MIAANQSQMIAGANHISTRDGSGNGAAVNNVTYNPGVTSGFGKESAEAVGLTMFSRRI